MDEKKKKKEKVMQSGRQIRPEVAVSYPLVIGQGRQGEWVGFIIKTNVLYGRDNKRNY